MFVARNEIKEKKCCFFPVVLDTETESACTCLYTSSAKYLHIYNWYHLCFLLFLLYFYTYACAFSSDYIQFGVWLLLLLWIHFFISVLYILCPRVQFWRYFICLLYTKNFVRFFSSRVVRFDSGELCSVLCVYTFFSIFRWRIDKTDYKNTLLFSHSAARFMFIPIVT